MAFWWRFRAKSGHANTIVCYGFARGYCLAFKLAADWFCCALIWNHCLTFRSAMLRCTIVLEWDFRFTIRYEDRYHDWDKPDLLIICSNNKCSYLRYEWWIFHVITIRNSSKLGLKDRILQPFDLQGPWSIGSLVLSVLPYIAICTTLCYRPAVASDLACSIDRGALSIEVSEPYGRYFRSCNTNVFHVYLLQLATEFY